jgi:DNA-directed RNA polymerase specialized sigma24 family protein
LGYSSRSQADEEDLAICVLTSFFSGVKSGRNPNIRNRDELWQLLELITKRRATDHARRETAAKRSFRPQQEQIAWSVLSQYALTVNGPLEEPISQEISPEIAAELNDELRHLQSKLQDDELRSIVAQRLTGMTNPEIAASLGRSLSSIERKMRLIKETWLRELPQ